VVLASGLSLILSGCASSTTGNLTGADIPGSLGLSENHQAEAGLLRAAHPGNDCRGASVSVAAFTPAGMSFNHISGHIVLDHDQVLSDVLTCPSASRVQAIYQFDLKRSSHAEQIDNVGERAFLTSFNPDARSYAVEWLQGATSGLLVLQGAKNDSRITPQLAEMLAREAVAHA
jgi:hypothetical protein